MTLLEQVRAARQRSVPIISISCPDPQATISAITKFYDDKEQTKVVAPLIQWDCARGCVGLNKSGVEAIAKLRKPIPPGSDDSAQTEMEDASVTLNLTDMLHRGARVGLSVPGSGIPGRLPERTCFIVINAHMFLREGVEGRVSLTQAVWNCRDPFKANFRTLILLSPDFVAPPELGDDILPLSEPLPGADQLKAIVAGQYDSARKAYKDMPALPAESLEKGVDAIRGLANFPAEQVVSLALTAKGLDLDLLWERKRKMIETCPGLSVWRGGETFKDVGGLANIKQFMHRTLRGKAAPRVIVFIDEIEKALAGAVGIGDSTGVSQAMLGTLLTYMEDTKSTGCIFIGPAGVSKSMMAKAAGNEAGIPTIAFDLSGMKAAYVGQSEANLRRGLRVVSAVSDGSAMFIATCNEIALMPPPLRRRFTFGTYFFDFPDTEERKVIWDMYLKKYGVDPTGLKTFNHEGWSGAEIRQCVDIAWRLDLTLSAAAKYVTPVSIAAKEQVDRLRKGASNRFISASHEGLYQYKPIAGVDEIETIPFEPEARAYGVN